MKATAISSRYAAFKLTSRLLLLLVVDNDDIVHLLTGYTTLSHLDSIRSHKQHLTVIHNYPTQASMPFTDSGL